VKRAIILIAVLTVICLSVSIAVDLYEARTAESYLQALRELREVILAGDMAEARAMGSRMSEQWRHDSARLNFFISHHRTRLVTTAMLQLTTALEMEWRDDALKAVDLIQDALDHVHDGDFYRWENFF